MNSMWGSSASRPAYALSVDNLRCLLGWPAYRKIAVVKKGSRELSDTLLLSIGRALIRSRRAGAQIRKHHFEMHHGYRLLITWLRVIPACERFDGETVRDDVIPETDQR